MKAGDKMQMTDLWALAETLTLLGGEKSWSDLSAMN